MKTRTLELIAALLILSILGSHVSTACAQGVLTPPGAPGPTMKTLAQIEPRTPISSLPFSITAPGSYYVTTNLTGTAGITIASGSVTLDLHGFTLAGSAGSSNGISSAGFVTNVVIENGTVSGWGGYGVDADGVVGGQFLQLYAIGNKFDGLDVGQDCLVRSCTAIGNIATGFGNLGNDFETTYEDCIASVNGYGFATYHECSFLNCRAHNNINDGFEPGYDCLLRDCNAGYNGAIGIWMPNPGCSAIHCIAAYSGEDGIDTDHGTLTACISSYNGNNGYDAGSGTALNGCSSSYNGGQGYNAENFCSFSDCSADTNYEDNVVTGFGCTLDHCSAGESETGNGFTLGTGSTITGCTAYGNPGNGIDAGDRTMVRGCTATFNGNAGIHVAYQGTVQNCTCGNNANYGILSDANGYASILENNCSYNGISTYGGAPAQGAGILITNSAGCRIEGNTLNLNYAALIVGPSCHAFILRNSANGNISTNYALASGNSWGPIVNISAGGDISSITGASQPTANFIH